MSMQNAFLCLHTRVRAYGTTRNITVQKHCMHHSQVSENELQDYLRRSTRRVNMHKVIIVGDGRLGKTSLLRCLRGEKFNENEQSTRGANMMTVTNRWQLANLVDVAEIIAEEQGNVQPPASNSCRVCKRTFGMFRKEHTCRECGRLVCNKCSKYAPPATTQCGLVLLSR